MKHLIYVAILVTMTLFTYGGVVFAQDTGEEVSQINNSIQNKKESLDFINDRISQLQDRINELNNQAATLIGQTQLLENRIEKTRLDIEATQLKSDTLLEEIMVLDREIDKLMAERDRQRASLITSIREINYADGQNKMTLVFGTQSFSEFFERVRTFESMNRRLKTALVETKEIAGTLEGQRSGKEDKLAEVDTLKQELEGQELELLDEEGAKSILLSETRESEAEFEALKRELLQEQSYIQSQIMMLQSDIEERLRESDDSGTGSSALSWPLDQSNKRVTATFHDPTYPFRHLFEHSGLDVAAPIGSPVRSPAPGYVAWTRQGRLYGNYMMVIHANGIATLYAHLSAFDAQADDFVARGEIIGRVGSTGFSTGPHLHFEVRSNGIPTNPMNYLVGL